MCEELREMRRLLSTVEIEHKRTPVRERERERREGGEGKTFFLDSHMWASTVRTQSDLCGKDDRGSENVWCSVERVA